MVQLVTHLRRLAWLVFVALAVTGCARQPDAEWVRQAVQQQLDAALGGRVLQIEQFRRAGSQALASGAGRLVYFDAQLKLMRSYDFTQWDNHNVATLGNLLGAGPRGLIGLKPGGNPAGDLLGVYGSAAFADAADKGWQLLASAPAREPGADAAPATSATNLVVNLLPKESPPPSAAELALERLAALFTTRSGPPGLSAARRDAIVIQEMDAAFRNAQLRLAQAAGALVLAAGPVGGAYAEVAQTLSERALKAGVPLELLSGEGSVDNLGRLSDGDAQFALVQNDIAAAAVAGTGRFAGNAQPELRAVASLFPEAIQLVVRADGAIRNIADLKGKRVDLGPERSGTRSNALAILAANGVAVDTLAGSSSRSLPEAAALLAAGKIDALFATVHAPARALQAAAAQSRLTWIKLLPTEALRNAGLVPLQLPARTYAGQLEAVQTLAVTGLMLTRADVPAQQVDDLLALLFARTGGSAPESSAVQQINRRTARTGVVISWHPAAEQYLNQPVR